MRTLFQLSDDIDSVANDVYTTSHSLGERLREIAEALGDYGVALNNVGMHVLVSNDESNVFEVEVIGKAVAQARPRFTTRGGFARAYDTKSVAYHKDYFKLCVAQNRPPVPFLGPCRVKVEVFIAKPKSWSKKRTQASTKPDADNLAKLCLDAMEGVVYKNDSQIVDLHVTKSLDALPRTFVRVEELDESKLFAGY